MQVHTSPDREPLPPHLDPNLGDVPHRPTLNSYSSFPGVEFIKRIYREVTSTPSETAHHPHGFRPEFSSKPSLSQAAKTITVTQKAEASHSPSSTEQSLEEFLNPAIDEFSNQSGLFEKINTAISRFILPPSYLRQQFTEDGQVTKSDPTKPTPQTTISKLPASESKGIILTIANWTGGFATRRAQGMMRLGGSIAKEVGKGAVEQALPQPIKDIRDFVQQLTTETPKERLMIGGVCIALALFGLYRHFKPARPPFKLRVPPKMPTAPIDLQTQALLHQQQAALQQLAMQCEGLQKQGEVLQKKLKKMKKKPPVLMTPQPSSSAPAVFHQYFSGVVPQLIARSEEPKPKNNAISRENTDSKEIISATEQESSKILDPAYRQLPQNN